MEAKAKFFKPAAMKYLEIYFSQKSECDNKFKKNKVTGIHIERMEANGGKIKVFNNSSDGNSGGGIATEN